MKKTYQYILFDWDGCLAKTLQIHMRAYKETFAEYNIFPTDLEITQKVLGDWNGPAKLGIKNVSEYTEKYLERVRKYFVNAPLYPHALETVQFLSEKGKQLALVTTSTIELIAPALEKTKIQKYFCAVLTTEDVSVDKPAPEIIEKALLKLGGNKTEAIIIGDSKSDLGAAQNAGIDSILFYPDDHKVFYTKESLDVFSPTYVISDHAELKDIIMLHDFS